MERHIARLKQKGYVPMSVPWMALKFILKMVGPNIPGIISTVKSLRTDPSRGSLETADQAARIQRLEKSLDEQLRLIEQLSAHMEKTEKAFRFTLLLSLFAVLLSVVSTLIIILK